MTAELPARVTLALDIGYWLPTEESVTPKLCGRTASGREWNLPNEFCPVPTAEFAVTFAARNCTVPDFQDDSTAFGHR